MSESIAEMEKLRAAGHEIIPIMSGSAATTDTRFGTALKEKFTYDSESGQMLDIINDTLTVSFAYVYDNWQGFGHMLGAIFSGNSPKKDYASFYASRVKSAEKRRDLIVDFFEANK